MLADPFTSYRLVNTGAETQILFARISVNGNSASYTRNAYEANSGGCRDLHIRHNIVGKGAGARDRHLVRLDQPQLTDGVEDGRLASIYTVVDAPRGIHVNALEDLYRCHLGLLAQSSLEAAYGWDKTAFWDKFTRGES